MYTNNDAVNNISIYPVYNIRHHFVLFFLNMNQVSIKTHKATSKIVMIFALYFFLNFPEKWGLIITSCEVLFVVTSFPLIMHLWC